MLSKSSSLSAFIKDTIVNNITNIKRNAGANITPPINSLIVLPFEIRAMNVPTNGAHAIHQA